ncbi:hypothetical protein [uncultured Boseongicola sp.]|jgi:hypothetical protein|uniref:hypothetical protein n=1 Tax=uncultured Boseongicola sp. TaxID=1648499 RepID=UPI00260FCF78|nr:hypothetical protein [uncultured Boseongicola sp.]
MRFIKFLSATILATSLALPSLAFDAGDKTRLEQALQAYAADLQAADYKAVVAAIPPGVIDLISAQAKLSPETIRTSVTAQMATIMSSAEVEDFLMDFETMTSGTTTAGTNYAFLPTTSRIAVGDNPVLEAKTLTLAVDLDNTWHLMRIELDQHYTIFRAAYPEFADIPLPE